MKKLIPIVLMLLVACVCVMPLAGCGGKSDPENDSAAIADAINAYYAAYNAGDYQQCLNYALGSATDDQAAFIAMLHAAREATGPITVEKIEGISVSEGTAVAAVTTSAMGESSTEEIEFLRDGLIWKIIFAGEDVAIEETINAYFDAFNAKGYQTCLNYMYGLNASDKAACLDALQKAREESGTVMIKRIQAGDITGTTATASITLSRMNEASTTEMRLIKEGGVWKLVPE